MKFRTIAVVALSFLLSAPAFAETARPQFIPGAISEVRQTRQGDNEKMSEGQVEAKLIDLIARAQKAYLDLVFASEDLKVKQRSLDLAENTVKELKARVEAGILAPIDVVQAQLDVASRRNLVDVATALMTLSEAQLKKLVADETYPGTFLAVLQRLEVPRRPMETTVPGLAEAIATASENRPEARTALPIETNRAIEQQIALEVRNAFIAAETNRVRVDAAQAAREFAETKLSAEKAKFDLGVSTLRFVLAEQRNVAQAQTNEIQMVSNFTKSLVDLDRAMGMTLKRN